MNEDVYVSPNVWKIHAISYMHYPTVGVIIGITIGLLISYLFPMDQKIDPKLLAPCIRKFVNPDYNLPERYNSTKKNERSSNTVMGEEYVSVSRDTKCWPVYYNLYTFFFCRFEFYILIVPKNVWVIVMLHESGFRVFRHF